MKRARRYYIIWYTTLSKTSNSITSVAYGCLRSTENRCPPDLQMKPEFLAYDPFSSYCFSFESDLSRDAVFIKVFGTQRFLTLLYVLPGCLYSPHFTSHFSFRLNLSRDAGFIKLFAAHRFPTPPICTAWLLMSSLHSVSTSYAFNISLGVALWTKRAHHWLGPRMTMSY